MKITSLAYIAIATIVGTLATGCDDEESSYELKTSSVKITATHLNLRAQADTAFAVIGTEGEISARSEQSWLTTDVKGDTIYAYAIQNDSLYSRAARVVVYQHGDSTHFTVQQQGVLYYVSKADTSIVGVEGAVLSIAVKHNLDIVVDELPDWITSTVDADTLLINVAPNNTGYSRSTYVKYTTGEVSDSVFISQKSGVSFNIAQTSITIDIDGGEETVKYSSNFPVEITAKDNWFSVELSEDKITISASKNSTSGQRAGAVNLRAGEVTQILTVRQDGGIVVRPEVAEYSFLYGQTEAAIKVAHNFDVEIISAPDWADVSLDGTTLSITLEELTNANKRTGKVVLRSTVDGVTEEATITLNQYFNILGDYKIYYYDKDFEFTSELANINIDDEDNLWLTFSTYGLKLSLLYDPDEGLIGFRSGQIMGKYKSYYAVDLFVSSDGYWTATGTNSLLTAEYEFDEEGVFAEFGGVFGKDDYSADCLYIAALSGPELTTTDDILGYLVQMWYPYLSKE